jgi:hypothetical protein
MATRPTAWNQYPWVDGNTALLDGGPWPWQYGSDEVIPVDVIDVLEEDEVVTNPTATLRRIPTIVESEPLAFDEGIVAAVASGPSVMVRLNNLERGRFYKLDVLIGTPGNRRGGNTIVQVSG